MLSSWFTRPVVHLVTKIITTINIRFVHLTLMISLCLSSIVNAMYLVALDTVITTLLLNIGQVTFDTINDISDGIIIKSVRISSVGLSFSFVCLQIFYRVKFLYLLLFIFDQTLFSVCQYHLYYRVKFIY